MLHSRLLHKSPPRAISQPKQLSQAVLDAVSEVSAKNFDKARRGLLTQGDLDAQIMAVRLLRAHFREVGFDAALKQALASKPFNPTDLRTPPNPDSIVTAMSKYGVQVTPDEVVEDVARLLPSDDATLKADFARFRMNGLDAAFPDIEGVFEKAKDHVPVSYEGIVRSGTERRIMACPPLLAYGTTAWGLATGVLAVGCGLPEPAWPFICPAMAASALTIAIVTLVVGAVAAVFCL